MRPPRNFAATICAQHEHLAICKKPRQLSRGLSKLTGTIGLKLQSRSLHSTMAPSVHDLAANSINLLAVG